MLKWLSLMLQQNQEFEQDETRSIRLQVGSSIASSPLGVWPQFGSPIENHGTLQNLSNSLPGLASILHPQPLRNIAPIGKDHGRNNNSLFDFDQRLSNGNNSNFQHSRSSQGTGSSFGTSGIETLSGAQFLWGSPGPTTHGFSIPQGQNGHFHQHVGSAPLEQGFGQFHDFVGHSSSFGGQMDHGFLNSHGSSRLNPVFLGNGHYLGIGIGAMNLESRNRRMEYNGNQMDNKKQLFQLDIEKIRSREDTRKTLMIKNIPNKYTSKMLLASIDEIHSGTYDFLYIPIDIKNKCNVGYAFINMLSPMHIIPFYQVFFSIVRKWLHWHMLEYKKKQHL
ncbi:hypothetical protein LXL04_014602 [Taraxacum kok-saghyz]